MFKLCFIIFFLLLPQLSIAAEFQHNKKKVDYTFEIQGGVFLPDDDQWPTFYGSRYMGNIGISLAYRFLNVLDLGVSYGYGKDKGDGYLPVSGLRAGTMTYETMAVDIFTVFRLRFTEGQWIVPYVGGGYTRFSYIQSVNGGVYTRGGVNGVHYRAGLQLLLDPLEPLAANNMFQTYGIINSYLVFEVKETKAEAGSKKIQIGGLSYRAGFLLEY